MCLFCKIANKEIPSKVLFEDADVLAFHDITPQAPTHVLVIPKRHVASLAEVTDADAALLGKLALAAKRAAEETGIAKTGFRVVMNSGAEAGQSVLHLHAHVLGGRHMGWPPG
jgi:histidine triad (HIT) family protein